MRDINVTIEVGQDFVYVMAYQGVRSPHQPGGMRILHKFYIERPQYAGSFSVPSVLELVGKELAKLNGAGPEQEDELPF